MDSDNLKCLKKIGGSTVVEVGRAQIKQKIQVHQHSSNSYVFGLRPQTKILFFDKTQPDYSLSTAVKLG